MTPSINSPQPLPIGSQLENLRHPMIESHHRVIILSITLLALVIAWGNMGLISRSDPWYRNTDMNIHNIVDALAINSDLAPNQFAQPALPLKYLLALDYRLRHQLGLLEVWNMDQLGNSDNPLREIPKLVQIGRIHSRILVIMLILTAAWLTFVVTKEWDTACFAIILLSGSGGLLFQGLLTRPELLCVAFGNLFALLFIWLGTRTRETTSRDLWLLLAGTAVGLSILEKLPAILYLVFYVIWCWMIGFTREAHSRPQRTSTHPLWQWGVVIPAAASVSLLVLLFCWREFHDSLGTVVLQRLRGIAVLIFLGSTTLTFWNPSGRISSFVAQGIRNTNLLVSGTVITFSLSFLFLLCVMSFTPAATYLTGALQFIVDPAPFLKDLAPAQNVGQEFLTAFKETPILFVFSTVMAIAVGLLPTAKLQSKMLIVLLVVMGWSLILLLSRRYFTEHYSIFAQVPLFLSLSIGFSTLRAWSQSKHPTSNCFAWIVPLAMVGALVITLSGYLHLKPKYYFYQNDVAVPVNEFTLTFLFDHDAHPAAYLEIMKSHYGNREEFAKTLHTYLEDPTNRY